MLSKTFGAAVYGVNATLITVEVSVVQGTGMAIVGLPDGAVKESQQRVDAALKNCNYQISRQKTVINLAPADIRKEGSAYDLPMALGLLAVSALLAGSSSFRPPVFLLSSQTKREQDGPPIFRFAVLHLRYCCLEFLPSAPASINQESGSRFSDCSSRFRPHGSQFSTNCLTSNRDPRGLQGLHSSRSVDIWVCLVEPCQKVIDRFC